MLFRPSTDTIFKKMFLCRFKLSAGIPCKYKMCFLHYNQQRFFPWAQNQILMDYASLPSALQLFFSYMVFGINVWKLILTMFLQNLIHISEKDTCMEIHEHSNMNHCQ